MTLGDEVAMPDESIGELLSELEESFEPAEDTPLELQPSEKAPVSTTTMLSDNDAMSSWVGDLDMLVVVRWAWCCRGLVGCWAGDRPDTLFLLLVDATPCSMWSGLLSGEWARP